VLPQLVVLDVLVQMLFQPSPVMVLHEPTDSREPRIRGDSYRLKGKRKAGVIKNLSRR
jgi:hypothetical protein